MRLRLAKKIIRPGVEKRRGTTVDRAYDRVSKLRPDWEMRYSAWASVMGRQLRRNRWRHIGTPAGHSKMVRYTSWSYGVTIPLGASASGGN